MLRHLRRPTLPLHVRSYVSEKEFRRRGTVHNQDVENIPTYTFPIAKKSDRRVYAWGLASTGALGLHKNLKVLTTREAYLTHHPTRQSFAERGRVTLDIACGYGFSVFVVEPDKNGVSLYGTGLNTDSQIGYHKLGGNLHKEMDILIYPGPIPLPRKNNDEGLNVVKSVAAGRAHMAALTDKGAVYTLGNNANGQCGRPIVEDEMYAGSQVIHRMSRRVFGADDEVKQVVCGQDHTMFVMSSGRLLSCGWGADGQTGLGHYNSTHKPTLVGGDISTEKIIKVSSSVDCVLAINDKGEVFGWGNSEYGQISAEIDEQQIHTPRHLEMTKICGKVIDIAAGGSSCLVLNEHGEVFVWGYGILGLGPNVSLVQSPERIPPVLFGRNQLTPSARVTSIYSGPHHMAAINDSHDCFTWGKNKFGALGLGHHDHDQFFPFKVAIGAKVEKVCCAPDHTIALCKPFI